jgi:ATP-dependent helicase HrpA
MFIRRALVAGEWESRHGFVETNDRFLERVAMLEARVRRNDLVDDAAIHDFFDERLPADITSGRRFDRWWRDERSRQPELLDFDNTVLGDRSGIRLSDYPSRWDSGGSSYPLAYRFDPSSPLDGASVTVPVRELNQLDGRGFDWLVPGLLGELVELLVRSLPKERRRDLIPMSDAAADACARLERRHGSLHRALAVALNEARGIDVRPDEFSTDRLPSHLRLHLIVIDDDGNVLDAGDDVAAVQARQATTSRSALAATVPLEERRDIVSWDDIGPLERVIEQRDPGGNVVRAFPTLLDRGDRVSLRVVDNEPLQRRAMRGGVRRLLLMAAAPTVNKVERTLDQSARLAVATSDILLADLAAECIDAAVDAVMSRYELPWDDRAFATIERAVRGDALQLATDALGSAADTLGAAQRVRARIGALIADSLAPTIADAEAHVERLVAPGFVGRTGLDRLPDLHRYVRAIEYRLDHLAGDVARDQRRMAEVRAIENEYAEAISGDGVVDDSLRDVAWMIEEFRVAQFAQPLGVHGPVSAKRIRAAVRDAT